MSTMSRGNRSKEDIRCARDSFLKFYSVKSHTLGKQATKGRKSRQSNLSPGKNCSKRVEHWAISRGDDPNGSLPLTAFVGLISTYNPENLL